MILDGYITSPGQIIEGQYYALPHELALAMSQIERLQAKRSHLAGHISEAMQQSSETWHDNAPADALFGEMRIIDNQELGMAVATRRLHLVEYPTPDFPFITIGSRATCSVGGDVFEIDIAGNLPVHYDSNSDVEVGSISAPMPKALLGGEPSKIVEVRIGHRTLQVGILAVDQTSQKLLHNVDPEESETPAEAQ